MCVDRMIINDKQHHVCSANTSGIASLEQMEQLLPLGTLRPTYVSRADQRGYLREVLG